MCLHRGKSVDDALIGTIVNKHDLISQMHTY